MIRQYTLTSVTIPRIQNKPCNNCNKKFKLNDIVVSKTSGRQRRYYHIDCARSKNLVD